MFILTHVSCACIATMFQNLNGDALERSLDFQIEARYPRCAIDAGIRGAYLFALCF